MNDVTETPQTDEASQVPEAGHEHLTEDASDADSRDSSSREAQRQRARRREVEAERDSIAAQRDVLQARVDTLSRAEAERIAGTVLADAADLWDVARIELAAVLREDGSVDDAAVLTAAKALVADRGPRFAHPRADWDGGADRGGRPVTPQRGWGAVFSPAYRDRIARAQGQL